MKNNIIENNFLYRPWEAIRISVRLDREVDGVLLERAVQQGAKRYPYLCVRVRRNGEELEMDFNENPVPVHRGRTPLVLGSESAGGHFIAVCYEGDWLFFDVYHNLCDANGLVCFIKTVMYLYLKSAADPSLDPTGILLPGTSIPESETGDPYEGLEFPKNIRPLYNRQFSRSFIPDRRYASGDSRYTYVVKTSQADFVRFFRTHDGSPITLASYFLKEMVKQLFPERDGLPICMVLPHSMAQDLRGKNNYHDQIMPLFIRYDEKMDALPVRAQLTAVRGSMILQMERNNILNFIQKTLEFSDQIDALKTVQEKRALCGRRAESIRQNPETICVTYPGHIDWGALSSYMKMAHLQCTVLGSPLFVTITTLKDDFWFCFIQRDETEVYARTFIDLLRENGISAELEERFREDAVEGQVP